MAAVSVLVLAEAAGLVWSSRSCFGGVPVPAEASCWCGKAGTALERLQPGPVGWVGGSPGECGGGVSGVSEVDGECQKWCLSVGPDR